jgi:succinoglycan biosynthesis transport protein ExoP
MNLSQFLLIFRAHYKIAIFTFVVTVMGTVIVSKLLPKSYRATTSLVLNYKGVDPVTGITLPAQLLPGYMATQVDIISSTSVALMVVDDLKLAEGSEVREQFLASTKGRGTIRNWLAELLAKNLFVDPSKESSVLTIGFKGSDPQFAATVANAYAAQYQKISIQLKVEPLKRAAIYFEDQIKILRGSFDSAQRRLSQYQQEHGLVSLDNRLDVETARLNDLSSQLVLAQGQVSEAVSRQKMVQGGNAAESPDVSNNPLIQNLKVGLGNAETKFADVSLRLAENHPQYQAAQSEVNKLRATLSSAVVATANGVSNNADILQRRAGDVRAALAAQKTKVLGLNRARDELAVLVKEMEGAQRAYEVTSQRFMQTNLEGQSNQSDIAVLNLAVAPLEAASPKIVLNVALSLVIGGMLGLGFSLLAEMLDRRVRSAVDLVDVLEVPVLGVMTWSMPKPRRAKWLRWPKWSSRTSVQKLGAQ